MNGPRALARIKKLAALLLLACFFLPLSRCTVKPEPDAKVVASETVLYGFKMAQEAFGGLAAGQPDSMGALLAVFIVFFVPAICLRFNDRIQVPIYLLSSVASAYILYCWLFVFATSVEIGGVIASACWLLLFYVSCVTIFSQWRLKQT